MELHRPRQWARAGWVSVYEQLELDDSGRASADSRKGRVAHILQTLVSTG